MKKIFSITLITLVLFASFNSSAQTAISPSSKLYFFQSWGESIKLFFLFSKQAKADYLLELTDRRVEELKVAPASIIANDYTKHFQKLGELAEGAEADKKEQLAERIKEASLRQQEVLAEVYNRVPEQAQAAILNAQENSAKHVEQAIEAVQGSEKSQEYAAQAAQIQQAEKLQKQERIKQEPSEGNPPANPSAGAPKELKESKGLNELNSLNPASADEGQGEGSGNQVEPVAPAPPQSRQ